MTVKELQKELSLEVLSMPEPDRRLDGVYAGDLLSWVMGRASEGNVWATIMTNMNTVAVATLVGMSAVIICENAEIGDEVVAMAREKSVNLFRTDKPIYELCAALAGLANG